jgi:hypothetical protein
MLKTTILPDIQNFPLTLEIFCEKRRLMEVWSVIGHAIGSAKH